MYKFFYRKTKPNAATIYMKILFDMDKKVIKINEAKIREMVTKVIKKQLNEYGLSTFGSDGDEPYDINDLQDEIIIPLMCLLQLQGEANYGEWSLNGDEEKSLNRNIEDLKDNLVWAKKEAEKIGKSINIDMCFNEAVKSCISGYEEKIKSAIPPIKKLLTELETNTFSGYNVKDGVRTSRGY